MRPTPEVLAAYGAGPYVVPLAGGQGTSWRAGDLVLKPVDMPEGALTWLDTVLRARMNDGSVRVSLPLRARDGALQVDGWCAFPHLAGSHEPGRWAEIAAAGATFARLTAGLPRPAFLDDRTDLWAVADRFAWGEVDLPHVRDVPEVAVALARRRGLTAPSTVMHGDLTGNVLFAPSEPPALIDLSLYWRPVRYGTAIVALDAVCFEGAPHELLTTLDPQPDARQYLLRALLFRMVTDLVIDPGASLAAYEPVLALL
ncbi:TIGR02569 family protein [Georgenia alba]|uniref:TIGR02569 family protein n=1 Tax=Georgenia alba TaxID=2233858 RepID=A0ABW2QB70_9MICO